MFDTIDKIVADVLRTWDPSDLIFVKQHPHDRAVGMQIRNRYGLWQDNPLTQRWRTDDDFGWVDQWIETEYFYRMDIHNHGNSYYLF